MPHEKVPDASAVAVPASVEFKYWLYSLEILRMADYGINQEIPVY